MSVRKRTDVVCDWCGKSVLLPTSSTDRMTAAGKFPKGWRTVQWDVYGNCTDYCCEACERSGRNDIENADTFNASEEQDNHDYYYGKGDAS